MPSTFQINSKLYERDLELKMDLKVYDIYLFKSVSDFCDDRWRNGKAPNFNPCMSKLQKTAQLVWRPCHLRAVLCTSMLTLYQLLQQMYLSDRNVLNSCHFCQIEIWSIDLHEQPMITSVPCKPWVCILLYPKSKSRNRISNINRS